MLGQEFSHLDSVATWVGSPINQCHLTWVTTLQAPLRMGCSFKLFWKGLSHLERVAIWVGSSTFKIFLTQDFLNSKLFLVSQFVINFNLVTDIWLKLIISFIRK